jgi:NAD(P)-dependent dehydrogenase (short-subunit alcohol dehydrogenase family)
MLERPLLSSTSLPVVRKGAVRNRWYGAEFRPKRVSLRERSNVRPQEASIHGHDERARTELGAPAAGRLAGKVVLVTGATSGIGEAIARRLAAEGASVLATGRSVARGYRLAADVGAGLHFHPAADISDESAADELTAAAVARFGRLDVLVNNAAVDHTGDLMLVPDKEVRQTFEVNTFAAIRLLQSAARTMQTRGGAIINITSRLASIGVPTMGIYSASKGAMLALTRAAAVELAPHSIRVNAIAPGMTKTPLYDEWLSAHENPAAAEARVVSQIPLSRLADPADVAAAVVYLASDEASYITGVSLPIDGGYTAH